MKFANTQIDLVKQPSIHLHNFRPSHFNMSDKGRTNPDIYCAFQSYRILYKKDNIMRLRVHVGKILAEPELQMKLATAHCRPIRVETRIFQNNYMHATLPFYLRAKQTYPQKDKFAVFLDGERQIYILDRYYSS